MPEALLTPREVAAIFSVCSKTVTRWADAGRLTTIRTLGGHRRFYESEVRRGESDLRVVPVRSARGRAAVRQDGPTVLLL